MGNKVKLEGRGNKGQGTNVLIKISVFKRKFEVSGNRAEVEQETNKKFSMRNVIAQDVST